MVKSYLFFLGGKHVGKELLEDLHQEVMMSIHQKKQTYQIDRPILPWIYSITK
jgi:DNA-directed RNA polymerase specialized sigma24 family protein